MAIAPRKFVLHLSVLSAAVGISSAVLWAQSNGAPAIPATPKSVQPSPPSSASVPVAQQSAIQSMEASIARQRASIRAQAGAPEADFFATGWISPRPMLPIPAGCEPVSATETEAVIKDAARAQNLNPALLNAVVRQESGYQSCVVSEKGAMGLMQLMPDTADQFHVADPFDARQNIEAGAQYLRALLRRYKGDLRLALAAYNAGPAKVDGPPPAEPDIAETRDYVNQIMKALNGAPPEAPDAIK